MDFTALLLLVGLMGTVCSSIPCPQDCSPANFTLQYFKHVSELKDNPMAPWELRTNSTAGREPEHIEYAHCTGCNNNMKAEPILFEISVYQTVWEGGNTQLCRCPFNLAVGCTCVKK